MKTNRKNLLTYRIAGVKLRPNMDYTVIVSPRSRRFCPPPCLKVG
jgi:hypothetical protein